MTKRTYRTSDLSKMFDVHQNTIRSYADNMQAYLSEDALVIYTVVKMRDIGISFDEIAAAISEDANEDKQTRIIELERDLSSAKAQLDIIARERPSALFWLAVILGVAIAVTLIVLGLTLYFSG